MKLSRILLAVPAAAAILFAAPTAAFADESVHVRLDALNMSGASGTATLTAMDNGDLKVSIRSKGLVPNSPRRRDGERRHRHTLLREVQRGIVGEIATSVIVVSPIGMTELLRG